MEDCQLLSNIFFYVLGVTGLFYLFFFSGLIVLFSICMVGLMATIRKDKPTWTLDQSLIGSSPGLGFRPISDNPHELALIFYKNNNETQIKTWTRRLDDYLERKFLLQLQVFNFFLYIFNKYLLKK